MTPAQKEQAIRNATKEIAKVVKKLREDLV